MEVSRGNEDIKRRRSSTHLSILEKKFEIVNKIISVFLTIYCLIQIIFSFMEDEKKWYDISANILSFGLSIFGALITWQAIRDSHKVGIAEQIKTN